MRPTPKAVIAGLLSFGSTTQAFALWDRRPLPNTLLHAPDQQQRPIFDTPGPIAMPLSSPPPSDPNAGGPGPVILSDVMARDKSINIFAGLVRDVASISQRLDDAAQNSTVLAPLNSAMEKMPRKPWEYAREYGALGEQAYEGDEGMEGRRGILDGSSRHILCR